MNNYIKTNYDDINEVVYKKVLNNGLTIFINKKQGFNKIFASFITNFGASDTKFIPIDSNEYFIAPLGVAHFLEHKMFEMPDGIDASNSFLELGADSNAYTDYNETAYVASCTENFEQVIELLLDFVQTPYFTDENVEKEKGIIIEELNMYQDNPSDRLYNLLMRNMYKYNSRKEDVVGSIDSINSISKEILYKCYHTFYHPKNMFLCISGDVDVDKTFELIENNQSKKEFMPFKPLKCKYHIENNKVFKKSGSTTMDIVIPRVSLAIKYPVFEFEKEEMLKLECISKIILEYKFGFSSENYQYMLDEDLVTGLSYTFLTDKCSSFMKFTANSYNPKPFINYLKQELFKMKDFTIDEQSFENIKRGLLGSFIKAFDNVEFVSSDYIDYLFKNSNLFNIIEIINSIKIEDLQEFCKYINEDSISYYIIKPKE